MKSFFVIALVVTFFCIKSMGQQKKEINYISKKDIIGTWQRGSNIVGSGLRQNFKFFQNDSFVLNIGEDGDDMRDIIQLKGKYRLVKDSLFFTIKSRTVIDGTVELSDGGISLNIFSIKKKQIKEVPEPSIKELPEPCYITFFSKTDIKINQERYYRIGNL